MKSKIIKRNQIKSQIKNHVNSFGNFIKHQELDENLKGTKYKTISFVVNYEKAELNLALSFYKPNNEWLFYNITYQKPTFFNNIAGEYIRVFNLKGRRLGHGKIHVLSDSILELKRGEKYFRFDIHNIGKIKTKKPNGRDVFKGTIIGASVFGVIGFADGDDKGNTFFDLSAGDKFIIGAVFGGVLGTGTGVVSLIFKKSEKFIINGDLDNWKTFKKRFNK